MADRTKKQKPFWDRDGFTFGLSLVTVSALFVFFGYLMGQYAVRTVGSQTIDRPPVVEQPSRLTQEVDDRLQELPAPDVSAPTSGTSPAQDQPQIREVAPSQPASASQTTQRSPSDPGALYRVQAGAFSQRENAERVTENLKNEGYEAIITSGPPFRVQTGAFSSQENAEAFAEELRAKGFEVVVVRP